MPDIDETDFDSIEQTTRYCVERSKAWFPNIYDRGLERIVLHHSLGLGGEAGEVLNVVKKFDTGKLNFLEMEGRVGEELADVFVYVVNLADAIGINLSTHVKEKMAKNEERFG